MTIKELEEKSGMDRTTIRFYEKQGFISPTRMENNYRDYSEDDLELLLRIKLLRSLHISLDDIKELQSGMTHLNVILTKQLRHLEEESHNIFQAKEICQMIKDDNVTFSTLDTNKYFNYIPKEQNSYFQVYEDTSASECHPWQRYFARGLDWIFYGVLTQAILIFVFHVSIFDTDPFFTALNFIFQLLCMLLIEPLFLSICKTTPGKFIFGFSLSKLDGSRLTYKQGFERTKLVLFWGWGLNIPLLSLIFGVKSYSRCKRNESQPWDIYGIKFSKKNYSNIRLVLIPLYLITSFVLLFATITSQFIPPNRGDLTVEEFVENFHHYEKLTNTNFGKYELTSNGTWKKKENGYNIIYESTDKLSFPLPNYKYELTNGVITGISFDISVQGNSEDWLSVNTKHTAFVSMAFMGAHLNMFEFLDFCSNANIEQYMFENKKYQSQFDNILIETNTEYKGYHNVDHIFLLPNDNAKEYYYQYQFSLQKQN